MVQQNHHSFQDFIVGEVAYTGTNKSGEWILFWVLLLLGCILAIVLACVEKRHEYREGSGKRKWLFYSFLCFLPMLTHFIFYGKTVDKMMFITVIAAVIVMVCREKSIYMAALFLCLYFAIESAVVLSAMTFHWYFPGDYGILFISICIFVFLAYLLHKSVENQIKFYERLLAALQIPVPFLFLLYLKNQYNYGGIVFQADFPRRYVFIMLALTVLLLAYQVAKAVEVFKKGVAGGKRIWFPTVFSIFAFVSCMPPAMLVQSDLHHHGEQILPWQQIVELGQRAYVDYSPASGLFPMLTGAVNYNSA